VAAVARASPTSTVCGLPAGLHAVLELAGGGESTMSRQPAWRRLGVKGLHSYRHPDVDGTRDGVLIGYAAPTPSAWSAALDGLIRLLP
jgi:GntR family transcriptional regulator / MocR family aminotransferase